MPGTRRELLVLLGGAGDLITRHVVPALAILEQRGLLDGTNVRLVDRVDLSQWAVQERLTASVRAQRPETTEDVLRRLLARTTYVHRDLDSDAYDDVLDGATYVHLALPPVAQPAAARALRSVPTPQGMRVVVEKPYGLDGASARTLDEALRGVVPEERLFRADHLLHHRAVRDLEPVRRWLLPRIDELRGVTVVWGEHEVPSGREAFFDATGTLVDMVQSHLLQLVAAMLSTPSDDEGAERVQQARADVLAAIEPVDARRARYRGYPELAGIDSARGTETWVDARMMWGSVPLRIVTGRALGGARREVILDLAGEHVLLDLSGRRLITNVVGLAPSPADDGLPASAVQLLAALAGDRRGFLGLDEVREQWRITDSVRHRWSEMSTPMEEYETGSTGPAPEVNS